MYLPDEVLIGVVGALVILCVLYSIAASRRSDSATVQNSSRVSRVPSKLAPAAAFKAVIVFAQGIGYPVSSIDEPALRLCLEEGASFHNFGFFIPINVVPGPEGGAVVEIGTKYKMRVGGLLADPLADPMLARAHDKCVSGIRAALFAVT